jgi:class 3 adenylate cyclase
MGFSVDVVGYSARSSPAKLAVQTRLVALLGTVLHVMDLVADDVDLQSTGDGVNLFLPVDVELHHALPLLISAWDDCLAVDNQHSSDELRIRMAVVVGPVCVSPLGFGGNTIVEANRLLDSTVLRRAIRKSPQSELAVLVSDQLYRYVIGEGYPGLDPTTFQRRPLTLDGRHTHAWLWTSQRSK